MINRINIIVLNLPHLDSLYPGYQKLEVTWYRNIQTFLMQLQDVLVLSDIKYLARHGLRGTDVCLMFL